MRPFFFAAFHCLVNSTRVEVESVARACRSSDENPMHQELQGICRRENSFLNWLGITIVAMFGSFGRNRLPWFILAVVLMFASDRKSTRLNSSHVAISYAVFCLKKKKRIEKHNKVNWRIKTPTRTDSEEF